MIGIEINNEQTRVHVDEERLGAALRTVLAEGGRRDGTVSLAIVDDATIHALNRRYLDHDYPTDVLSFLLDEEPSSFAGEIIVSADTAETSARAYGWSTADELLLYVIHGALHLIGFDDKTPAAAAQMRAQEALHLAAFGLQPRWQGPDAGADAAQRATLLGKGSQP